LLVLQGRPTLRTPEGEEQLGPWDVACFPPGPEGAHAVRNETDETVRVLMFSTVAHPAATVYPDSDIRDLDRERRRQPDRPPEERRRLLRRRARPRRLGLIVRREARRDRLLGLQAGE